MTDPALEQRVLDFIQGALEPTASAGADPFAELALAVFASQFERLPAYRQQCEALGITPATISDSHQIPAVAVEPAIETKSTSASGFRQSILRAALPQLFAAYPLWLVVSNDTTGDARSASVVDALAGGAPDASYLSRGPRLDAKRLRSWLGSRQRDRRVVQVISDSAGYASLVEVLERRGLKFRLPPGSGAFCMASIETLSSGLGNGSETEPALGISWNRPLGDCLGLEPIACRRVLCGPEHSTPLLEQATGPEGSFRLPAWVQATLDAGRLSIFDLASLATPAHRMEPVGARLEPAPSDQRGSGKHILVLT